MLGDSTYDGRGKVSSLPKSLGFSESGLDSIHRRESKRLSDPGLTYKSC